MEDELTQEAASVAVAMMCAILRGDNDGAAAVMATADPWHLASLLAGFCADFAAEKFGSPERAAEILGAWSPGEAFGAMS